MKLGKWFTLAVLFYAVFRGYFTLTVIVMHDMRFTVCGDGEFCAVEYSQCQMLLNIVMSIN